MATALVAAPVPAAQASSRAPLEKSGGQLWGAHLKVLVVEPDEPFRQEIAAALRARWMVVDQAGDGLAALHALAGRTPDLVVLNMDLPEVSGHRVYQVLRQDPATRRVPVIMLSEESCQEVCPRPVDGLPPECFLQKPVAADPVVRELARTVAASAHTHG